MSEKERKISPNEEFIEFGEHIGPMLKVSTSDFKKGMLIAGMQPVSKPTTSSSSNSSNDSSPSIDSSSSGSESKDTQEE